MEVVGIFHQATLADEFGDIRDAQFHHLHTGEQPDNIPLNARDSLTRLLEILCSVPKQRDLLMQFVYIHFIFSSSSP